MTPAARLAAAIEILAALEETPQPADCFLRAWWATRRYAGSKDRAAVGARVYDVLRHRARFAWRVGSPAPRALVLASLSMEGLDADAIAALFSGAGYGPSPLTEADHVALNLWQTRAAEMPPAFVAGEYPTWLEPELTRSLGEDVAAEMRAMQARAPVDLRVNILHSRRGALQAGLQELGFPASPTPFSPMGLRIASAEGLNALQRTEFFQRGGFEFQDEASQIAGLLCAPKPGNRVLDLAAGAGGKSLALAALMENKGEIIAYDSDPARLKPLAARARRAGAAIIVPTESKNPAWKDAFDIVLIDAPCSGSGTWRRNPELRWRLTPERLGALTSLQAALLDEGARYVRPGGRLVYATCSLLACENEDVIEAFLARPGGFAREDAAGIWRQAVPGGTPPGMAAYFRASPLRTGTDGFFVSAMKRA